MIIREARHAGISADALMAVGDIRRFEPAVATIELLGIAPESEHDAILKSVSRLPSVMVSRRDTARTIALSTERGQLRLHLAPPADAGAALAWHTGSRAHLAVLQQRAADRAMRFDDARLTAANGGVVSCPSEDELYDRLDLPYITPELRTGGDELTAAGRGQLPELVLERHIRGDLHMHSNWSDGRDTVERMVLASKQLGYEYVAITDHSQRAWSSHKLSLEDIPKQRAEIDLLRERIPGIDILHGIEVDMMPDGTLDFDDDVLAGFDIVLASLHVDAGHDRARLTARYLKAIRHPLVNVITHPSNRSPARTPGFDLDYDALFSAAAESGTAMEIDGAPGHLDMDGAIARRAAAAGVTITIDSDCHRAEWLARQMRFGVGTARRGWIEPRHVLNTLSADEIRAFVARKRARG